MKNLVVTLKSGVSVQMFFEKKKEAIEVVEDILSCDEPFCPMIKTAVVRVSEIALIEIMDIELEEEK